MKKLIALIFLIAIQSHAGTVTGVVQTSSSGAVPNGQFTFVLTQPAVIAGTATVVTSPSYCWTDTSGNVVGLPGDSAVGAPVLTQNLGAGTLAAGTYFVKYTWSNATGESQPSAERTIVLGGIGTLIATIPTNPAVPPLATAANIYISATSGSYTTGKQGTIVVTNGVLAGNFQQSAALAVGAAIPSTNSSACKISFNDQFSPSYTGYNVTLNNAGGSQIGGFPQKWYLSGGAAGTINLSNGTPLYSGIVVYPQAVVTTPAGNGQQSIAGPLYVQNLNGTIVFANSSQFQAGTQTCGNQEAINSIAGTGGTVNLNSCSCAIGVVCAVVCSSNITLQGLGSSVTILQSKNVDTVQLCNTVTGGLHEIRFRDFGIKPISGSGNGDGIDIIETASAFENSHNSFERITITNAPTHGFDFHNCSWCSAKDIVVQGGSGRGMEIGTAAGGKGGSANDSRFDNIEVSTNAFGGMLLWGRNDVFTGGHYFANTNNPDLEIRGSNDTFIGGWVEDSVFFPAVFIHRQDPIQWNDKLIGMTFTNTSGNGPVVQIGKAGDAAGSLVGVMVENATFTATDAPYPLTGALNTFVDIAIDASGTNTVLYSNTYHTVPSTALSDSGVNTIRISDDTGGNATSTLYVNNNVCGFKGLDAAAVNYKCFFTLNPSNNIVIGPPGGTTNLVQADAGFVAGSFVFANLGTPTNGTTRYCSDCNIANPCTNAGTGAFAKRINGAWVCN